MLSSSTRAVLEGIFCSACRSPVKCGFLGLQSFTEALKKSQCRCRDCGGSLFNATFTVTRETKDYSSAVSLASGFLGCGCLGLLMARAVSGGGQSGKLSNTYDVAGVEGAIILDKLEGPVEECIEWLVEIVKDTVKANLADNQSICLECGGVFVRTLAGHSTEGFCSPICKRKHQGATAEIVCPNCSRVVKVNPGGRCMFCGKPV